ncbi:MAG: Gfo/Idh/MocA family protein [Fidelibacterota bacterium]
MKEPKKICLVGAGAWGKNHLRTLNELKLLAGVVEINSPTRTALKEHYPKIELFSDLDAALNQDYDGFVVATPPGTHAVLAEKIIRKGIPVLIEKPLTLNYEDALKLSRISSLNNNRTMVGHVLLFHPAIETMKNLIEKGTIGELQYLYSNRLNLGTIRSHENVFWSFAPHDISIFQYFTESFPRLVTSTGGAFIQVGIHDITLTQLTYPNDVQGHIFVSWLHPFKEHRLVVVGSKGMLRFEDSADGKPLLFYDKGIELEQGVPVNREGPTERIPYDTTLPLTRELLYFGKVLEGQSVGKADLTSGLEVIRILELATESLLKQEENK